MSEKVVQLVKSGKISEPEMSPEFRKALDEMIQEIQSGKKDFVLMIGDDEGGNGVSFITNLDLPSSNLLLDQVKLHGLLYGAGV